MFESPSSRSKSSSSSSSQHVHTTADGTFPRPSYTETLLDGVWFQLLTCTTAGTRSHCHIVATLGSSTQQETLIVGGLMKGSKRLYRCDSAWSSHHAHNLHSSQVLPGNLLVAYWYYRSLLAAS